jgi:hypothetical protein
MDQGAGCPVCYQPPCFCSEVRDNTSYFSIKIVEDDFEDGVVSSYIFLDRLFKWIKARDVQSATSPHVFVQKFAITHLIFLLRLLKMILKMVL